LHVRAGAPAVIVRREDLIVTREERERFERDHATLLSEPISACKLRCRWWHWAPDHWPIAWPHAGSHDGTLSASR